jgi:diguanylate cyclase (GGDEF)-like protein
MNPTSSELQPRHDLRRLTVVISGAIAFFGIALIAIIAFAGWSANHSAIDRDRTLVANALNQNVARVLSEQKSIAYWDDAVQNIAIAFNLDWVNTQFGTYLSETYGQDEIYILNGDDTPIYTMKEAAPIADDLLKSRMEKIAPVVTEARTGKPAGLAERPDLFGPSQEHFEVFSGVLACARYRGHILAIDGQPAVVTAITVCPTVDTSLGKGTIPYMLVSVVYIDKPFVDEMGRSLLLPDLDLTKTTPDVSGLVAEPFITDDGGHAGVLSWTPKRPGYALLTIILPLVIFGVVATGILTFTMLRRLQAASTELAQREALARYQARHDTLSGLPNRHSFVEKMQAALKGLTPDQRLTVAYIDVDRFKDTNDTLGHHAGDELIKAVAGRIQEYLSPGDFLSRFGGDEFAVLAPPAHPGHEKKWVSTLMSAFDDPFIVFGQNIKATASIGVASAPDHGANPGELMRNADIALYAAKERGRDQAVYFSAEMADQVKSRRQVEVDLRDALQSDQLSLHYQPIVSCSSGAITGVEALLRWRHPTHGDISPAVFIPIAEEAGLMPELGAWVLNRAFADSARWPDLEVALNLSPAQFHHVDLEHLLGGLMETYSIDPKRIVLEITEGLLLESSARVISTLEGIRKMGFKVALDDFGTGYSSLSYLHVFKFDKLKIDRSFVRELSTKKDAKIIVQAVINLGRGLGMEIIAEGVENETEAATMRVFGCTAMQGFLFSKAVLPEAIASLVEKFAAANPLADSAAREAALGNLRAV